MEKWSEILNIPFPECNKCGTCCSCASPSSSYKELLEKASQGDEFAIDFFSIFIPYEKAEAEKIFPTIVERTVKATQSEKAKIKPEELVFYKCRYHSEEKQCLIYEDRPELCRDFPGTPYCILSEKCAYYNWSKECRDRYEDLKEQLELLKKCKEELNNIKYQRKAISLNRVLKKTPEEYKFMIMCPSLSIVSPKLSILQ